MFQQHDEQRALPSVLQYGLAAHPRVSVTINPLPFSSLPQFCLLILGFFRHLTPSSSVTLEHSSTSSNCIFPRFISTSVTWTCRFECHASPSHSLSRVLAKSPTFTAGRHVSVVLAAHSFLKKYPARGCCQNLGRPPHFRRGFSRLRMPRSAEVPLCRLVSSCCFMHVTSQFFTRLCAGGWTKRITIQFSPR